jgi:hypothetical protein
MFGLKPYELMTTGRKDWPFMVRKHANAIAYFKHRNDAVAWLKQNT